MTLRYDVKSWWMQSVLAMFASDKSEDKPESTPPPTPKKDKLTVAHRKNVMKLFINFNDCLVDYLPPLSFFPSRLLLQISNIRIASNIISKAFVQVSELIER